MMKLLLNIGAVVSLILFGIGLLSLWQDGFFAYRDGHHLIKCLTEVFFCTSLNLIVLAVKIEVKQVIAMPQGLSGDCIQNV